MALSDEELLAVYKSLEKIAQAHLTRRSFPRSWHYELVIEEYDRIASDLATGIAFDAVESGKAISRAAERMNRERKREVIDGYNDEADAPEVTADLRDDKMPQEERESMIDDELEGRIPAPALPSDLDSPAYKKAWAEFEKPFFDSFSKPAPPPPETYSI